MTSLLASAPSADCTSASVGGAVGDAVVVGAEALVLRQIGLAEHARA